MATNQLPDFSFHPLQSPLQLAELRAQQQQTAFEDQRQKNADTLNRVTQISSLASNMVQNMVSGAAHRQMVQATNVLAQTPPELQSQIGLSSVVPPSPVGTPTTDQSGNMSTSSPMVSQDSLSAAAQDAQRRHAALLTLARIGAPQTLGENAASKIIPPPAKSLVGLAASQLQQTGQVDPSIGEAARSMKAQPKLSATSGTYQGNPAFGVLTSQGYVNPDTQERMPGFSPNVPAGQALAGVRQNQLREGMNKRANEDLNAFMSKSPTIQKNVQIVTNADSGIRQIDQVLNNEIVGNRMVMAGIAEDTARVMSQVGASSEQRVNNFMPQTARAKYASWQEWLTNAPQSIEAKKFLQNVRAELVKQREQRSNTVGGAIRNSVSSLNPLKDQYPTDFYDQLGANGFDVEAAKKGIYRYSPDHELTLPPTGSTQAPGQPIDMEAKKAALRAKLGL